MKTCARHLQYNAHCAGCLQANVPTTLEMVQEHGAWYIVDDEGAYWTGMGERFDDDPDHGQALTYNEAVRVKEGR